MKIIIFGTGKISEVVYYYLSKDTNYTICCFVVEKEYKKKETKFNLPIIDFEDIQLKYPPSEYKMFAITGADKLNKFRTEIYLKCKNLGYSFISYIHSKAIVMTDDIGENCFILENNVIQPFTKIGNNCVLWSGNHIGHHSIIKDHVFITSHVVISGMCNIGNYCYIGVNSSIKDNIEINDNTVIGMGSLVNKDTESYNIYIGAPAKKFKECDDTIKL